MKNRVTLEQADNGWIIKANEFTLDKDGMRQFSVVATGNDDATRNVRLILDILNPEPEQATQQFARVDRK